MDSQLPISAESNRPPPAAYRPLVVIVAAAAFGILADRAFPVPFWWHLSAAGFLVPVWFATGKRPVSRLCSTLLFVAVAAAGWHHCRWSLFDRDEIGRFATNVPRPCCVEGVVLRGPRNLPPPEWGPLDVIPRPERTRMDLSVEWIRDGTGFRAAAGTVAVYVDGKYDSTWPGERVRVFGRLVAPAEPANPGQVNRRERYRAQRIHCMIRSSHPSCVEVLQRPSGLSAGRLLEKTRRAGADLLERYLGRKNAGLAGALLLGARNRVDEERRSAFQETGTVHLLAISGLHVGIVYGGALLLARLLLVRFEVGIVVAAAVCVVYVLLTDARPPALRASMLVVVMSLAFLTGRRSASPNALAAAGILILLLNPADLFATGVQLSFLAVAGLIQIGRRWREWDRARDPLDRLIIETSGRFDYGVWWTKRKLWQLFTATATVWVLTTPLVLAEFHVISPIGLLLNMLLSVPLTGALAGGFGVLLLGAWFPLGARTAALWCNTSLNVIDGLVTCGQSVPGGHFWLPGPPRWWLMGFYGGAVLMMTVAKGRAPRGFIAGCAIAWCGIGCLFTGIHHRQPELTCTFLSVGHGLAVVLELPGGETVLCDAGQLSSASAGAETIADFLWSRGIPRIDAVVLSHPDADHYNAVPGLLEKFRVKTACVTPQMFQNASGAVEFLRSAFEAWSVEIKTIRRGDSWRIGECRFQVFHPNRTEDSGNDNANSLVLGIEYSGWRILITGDIEPPGTQKLISMPPWNCDVLLVPHHGSRSGHSAELTGWARPRIAIASSGSRGVHPLVAECYRRLGVPVLSTHESGAIRVRLRSGDLRAEPFLSSHVGVIQLDRATE